jgi:hypothetical protein
MADADKKMALCWGQAGSYDTEPKTSQGPWPLRAAALSCYWKLWMDALGKGFKGDEGHAWNEFTAQSMVRIAEDFHDDKDILSMMDFMAITDTHPPGQWYPNALLTAFNSQLTFGDTKISMEERSRRATTLKVTATAQ